MLDESTLRLIDETAAELNLKQVTIEKDYYVTQILNVLANVQGNCSCLLALKLQRFPANKKSL